MGARLHLRRPPGGDGAPARGLRGLRAPATPVRPADREVRVGGGPYRRHEGRDRGRALPALPRWMAQAAGQERGARGGDGQAVRERDPRARRPRRAPDLRRLRLHEGVSDRARAARRALGHPLLGHLRDAAQDHRALPGALAVASLLPRLLAHAAERHPARHAVVMDGARLSYEALESASSRFARSLIAHGVRRGDRVALWLPKSPRAIVALYGIMKAGAAYVPVDPGAPPARLAWIARNCEVAGLVTVAERAAQVDEAFAGGAPMRAPLM